MSMSRVSTKSLHQYLGNQQRMIHDFKPQNVLQDHFLCKSPLLTSMSNSPPNPIFLFALTINWLLRNPHCKPDFTYWGLFVRFFAVFWCCFAPFSFLITDLPYHKIIKQHQIDINIYIYMEHHHSLDNSLCVCLNILDFKSRLLPSPVHGSTRRFSGPDLSSFPFTSQACKVSRKGFPE